MNTCDKSISLTSAFVTQTRHKWGLSIRPLPSKIITISYSCTVLWKTWVSMRASKNGTQDLLFFNRVDARFAICITYKTSSVTISPAVFTKVHTTRAPHFIPLPWYKRLHLNFPQQFGSRHFTLKLHCCVLRQPITPFACYSSKVKSQKPRKNSRDTKTTADQEAIMCAATSLGPPNMVQNPCKTEFVCNMP